MAIFDSQTITTDITPKAETAFSNILIPTTFDVITNNDPIADLAGATSSRVTQQRIIPLGVKQRNIQIQLLNSPAADVRPFNTADIFGGSLGPIANNSSLTVTWSTGSPSGQEILAISQMSLYFYPTSLPSYDAYAAKTTAWPNTSYSMRNIFCSFWQDEAKLDTQGNANGLFSSSSCYNWSGADVYVMATIRIRILANVTQVNTL